MLGLPLWRNLVGIGRCQPAIVGLHIVTETGKNEQVPPIALGQSDCSIQLVQITAGDLQGGEPESLFTQGHLGCLVLWPGRRKFNCDPQI
jgi:hypothetical protein